MSDAIMSIGGGGGGEGSGGGSSLILPEVFA